MFYESDTNFYFKRTKYMCVCVCVCVYVCVCVCLYKRMLKSV